MRLGRSFGFGLIIGLFSLAAWADGLSDCAKVRKMEIEQDPLWEIERSKMTEQELVALATKDCQAMVAYECVGWWGLASLEYKGTMLPTRVMATKCLSVDMHCVRTKHKPGAFPRLAIALCSSDEAEGQDPAAQGVNP